MKIEEVDNNEEIILIRKDENNIDLLKEAIVAHECIAKTLWKYNLSKICTIEFLESSSSILKLLKSSYNFLRMTTICLSIIFNKYVFSW